MARCYAKVPVVVQSVDHNGIVKLSARTAGPTPEFRSIEVNWNSDEVWSGAPSTLPLVNGLPTVRSGGILYILGTVAKDKYSLGWDPKWPDCAAEAWYQPMKIQLKSVLVTGRELESDDETEAQFELLNPELASPDQALALAGGSTVVHLSEDGFNAFVLHFPTIERLRDAVERVEKSRSADTVLTAAAAKELASAWQVIATWSGRLERSDASQKLKKGENLEEAHELIRRALVVPR